MVNRDIATMRREYRNARLTRRDADADPFRQFAKWFDEASDADIHEPNAMHLSTVDGAGMPSGRVVLLKSFDKDGFVFFTNYESRKGRQIDDCPNGALTFWWGPLERQVRIEGGIARTSAVESDAYFRSRPPGSRLGAAASPQSQVIESAEWLAARVRKLEEDAGPDIERPAHWGGYRLDPRRIEFWQGRPSRLHDRLCYTREGNRWRVDRLAP